MLGKVFHASVLVGDQDNALDFYTNVLGLEKRVAPPTPGYQSMGHGHRIGGRTVRGGDSH
jgi:catechol 2,3-dioxygenase-like lactoylglutathione lyase family enzyme